MPVRVVLLTLEVDDWESLVSLCLLESGVPLLEVSSLLHCSLECGVLWSGFIGWNDESFLDESFPDFVVECKGD